MDTVGIPVTADLPIASSLVRGIDPVSDANAEVEPVVKEEEVVKKTTTELTTTKQIETRVKRQLMLEDGKVVQDTGPMVETNTTEDTDRQRRQTVERRKLGEAEQASDAITTGDPPENHYHEHLRPSNEKASNHKGDNRENTGNSSMTMAPPRTEGLVRATHTSVLLSREENNERLETEDVQHLGDFSDETYLSAVRAGHPNLGGELREAELELRTTRQQALVAEPRIVAHTHRTKRTVDTEDTDANYLLQPDGTLVTESKRTTGHEELHDDDVSEGGAGDVLTDEPRVQEKESSQKFTKQRDEQTVEIVADGQVIGKETRYAAETTNMEGEPHDKPGGECWDSLSDRMRKARRHQRAVLHKQQQLLQKGQTTQPGANNNNVADRKDALTERPLDFDREEQTRKGETMKWLENHFGSELSASTTSSSSLSAIAEPTQETRAAATKKTFFNVTFKSNSTQPEAAMMGSPPPLTSNVQQFIKPSVTTVPLARPTVLLSPSKVIIPERDTTDEPPPAHYQHQTATLERFRQHNKQVHQRHFAGSREDLLAISRKNELNRIGLSELQEGHHQPHQHSQRTQPNANGHYGSVQNLRESRARSNEPSASNGLNGYDDRKMPIPVPVKEDLGYLSGSRNDVRTIHETSDIFAGRQHLKTSTPIATVPHLHRKDSGYVRGSRDDIRAASSSLMHLDFAGSSDDRSIIGRGPKPAAGHVTQRPTVPQRRNKPAPTTVKTQSLIESSHQSAPHHHPEPRPDYPRSRSLTPPPLANIANHNLMQSTQTLHQQRPRPNHKKAASAPPPPILVNKSEPSVRHTDATSEHRKPSVTAAIGNSIRKFVDRLRSVSTDRRQRNKAAKLVKLQRSQSQEAPFKKEAKSSAAHSSGSSSMNINNYQGGSGGSTYQQYNVIDGHIGDEVGNGLTTVPRTGRNFRSASQDVDTRHKQSYFMGEDPYGDMIQGQSQPRPLPQKKVGSSLLFNGSSPHLAATYNSPPSHQQPQQQGQHTTLGRYSKSTNRLAPQQATLGQYHHQRNYQDYRSTQTLPRKLDQHRPATTDHHHLIHLPQTNAPLQNTGPTKPARTYNTNASSRIVNRSKSFNVHGLNGGNAPHQHAVPIFIEKRQPPAVQRKANSTLMYRSTPHLLHDETHRGSSLSGQLKSPSIVNLVSRSQRDLSRISENKADSEEYAYHRNLAAHSAGSRMSPAPVVNRDTASIVRGGSSSAASTTDESTLGQKLHRNRRTPSSNAKPAARKTLSSRY